MRNKITRVTKIKFLLAFKAIFNLLFIKNNILENFRSTSLVLFNLKAVLLKLKMRLSILILPPVDDAPWQSRTPSNTLEFRSQSKLLLERIQRHIDSSLTLIVNALIKFFKGVVIIAYLIVLITKYNAKLKVANKATTRYKLYKRKRVQREGTLTFVEGERLTTLKEFEARSNRKKAKKRRVIEEGKPA
jgi:hypothetical protein